MRSFIMFEKKIIETTQFYRNKEQLKAGLPDLKKDLVKLEKNGFKKESEPLRDAIKAIEAGTYVNKL